MCMVHVSVSSSMRCQCQFRSPEETQNDASQMIFWCRRTGDTDRTSQPVAIMPLNRIAIRKFIRDRLRQCFIIEWNIYFERRKTAMYSYVSTLWIDCSRIARLRLRLFVLVVATRMARFRLPDSDYLCELSFMAASVFPSNTRRRARDHMHAPALQSLEIYSLFSPNFILVSCGKRRRLSCADIGGRAKGGLFCWHLTTFIYGP